MIIWRKMWKGNPPDIIILIMGLFTALIMAVPILYVIWRSVFAGSDRWLTQLSAE